MSKDTTTKLIFPQSSARYGYFKGMTYRQWLIGQVASGIAANAGWNNVSEKMKAKGTIRIVDAILEEEGGA